MKPRLLGVVASLRPHSTTRKAVLHVLEKARGHGAEIDVVDLAETPLPMFDPQHRSHESFTQAFTKVGWANGFILGTPDYHGSMSGCMKNFLDYFWKEFTGKLFGYICASHEKGLTAMDHMRTSVRQCYGWSLPYGVSVTDGDFDQNSGAILNSKIEARLELMGRDLATYGPLLWNQYQQDASVKPARGFASMVSKS